MTEPQSSPAAGSFRDLVHSLLRTSILDAAWAKAAEVPWNQVRMADLADEVGVSRQTIYNEFGSKDDLVSTLLQRDLSNFLEGVEQRLSQTPAFDDAMRDTMAWLLDQVSRHKVLKRMVSDARAGVTDGLVPVLTVKADLITVPVREVLVEILAKLWPTIDREAAAVSADLTVRLVLSEMTTPTNFDREQLVDAIVALTLGLQPRKVT